MLGLNGTIPVLQKADFIVDSLNVECMSRNLADRGKEFDFVEYCATITNSYIQRLHVIMLVWLKHNHIQRLKNMCCMWLKLERNNGVVVVVLNKLNGEMGAVAI